MGEAFWGQKPRAEGTRAPLDDNTSCDCFHSRAQNSPFLGYPTNMKRSERQRTKKSIQVKGAKH